MKKVIIISGGSDGLGKATAHLLSKENTVVILAPNSEKTAAVAKEIGCDFEICDITKWDQLQKAVQNIIKNHSQIDVLVNNAGLWIEGELDQNDPSWIYKVIEVNTLGTILLSKAVIPQMKAQQSGLIINVISQAGLYAKEKRTVYNASKWAITGFTKALEKELNPYKIKVSGFYPSKINTKMFEKVGIHKDPSGSMDPKEAAQALVYLVSLPSHLSVPELGLGNVNYK